MKKILACLLVAGSALAMSSTSAWAWSCGARSATGSWGVGHAYSRHRAARIALTYCAVNTPRGYVCYVTRCH
jgi:hypothetical protein